MLDIQTSPSFNPYKENYINPPHTMGISGQVVSSKSKQDIFSRRIPLCMNQSDANVIEIAIICFLLSVCKFRDSAELRQGWV